MRAGGWRWIALLSAALAAFLVWQAVLYSGFVADLGEMQYRYLGRYYPALTIFIVALLCLGPAAAILLAAHRATPRGRADPYGVAAARDFVERRGGTTRACFALSALCLMIALFSAGALLFPQGRAEGVQPVATLDAVRGVLREGPATVTVPPTMSATAVFDEHVLLARRKIAFAPVGIGATVPRAPIRLLVELQPDARRLVPYFPVEKGELRRNALPGELRRLYTNAGYYFASDYYVLYRSNARADWRRYAFAAQFLVASVVLAAAGWIFRRRRTRAEARRARRA